MYCSSVYLTVGWFQFFSSQFAEVTDGREERVQRVEDTVETGICRHMFGLQPAGPPAFLINEQAVSWSSINNPIM